MTEPDEHPPGRAKPLTGSGIPRSQDQAMVMTQMLMRWRPRRGALRHRGRHKTEVHVNTGEPEDPAEAEARKIETGRRQALAEQSAHRFVGLHKAEAQVLADELGLRIRFFEEGEGLTEDYRPGRVTAGVADGVVVAAEAMC